MLESKDGNYYLVGSKRIINKYEDVRIINTSSNGKKIWDKNFGGNFDDIGEGIVETENNTFVVAASTFSYGTNGDAFLLKIDSSGNLIWQKNYGGDKQDQLRDVDGNTVSGRHLAQTLDGGFLVSGYTRSYAKQPDNPYCVTKQGVVKYTLCHENTDMWVFKTDKSGKLLWNYAYPTDNEDTAFSAKQSANGSVVITGMTAYLKTDKVGSSTSPFTYGTEDIIIVKIR